MAKGKSSQDLSQNRDYLYTQIADELKELIKKGAIKEGSRIPSLDDLARRFQVHKITAKKAVALLIDEGLVYAVRAKGTFVSQKQKGATSLNLGLISPVLHLSEFGPYHAELLSHIQKGIAQHHGNLSILPAANLNEEKEFLNLLNSSPFDAMIYMGDFKDSILKLLVKKGPPCVLIDYPSSHLPVPSVVPDNRQGGYLGMKHLIQKQHTRIVIITGGEHQVSQDRLNGVYHAIDEFKFPKSAYQVIHGNFTSPSAYEIMKKCLKSKQQPTAVFCFNDEMAIGALRAVHKHSHLKTPGDLDLLGFDDIPISSMMAPSLSTIQIDKAKLAQTAIQLLMENLSSQQQGPISKTLPVQLLLRESS